jgi:hypothetical protein
MILTGLFRKFLTAPCLFLVVGWSTAQSPAAVDKVKNLIELSNTNYRSIAGPYDETTRVWASAAKVEGTTNNWLLLDTLSNFCVYHAQLSQWPKLGPAKDAVNNWANLLRPTLAGFSEKYNSQVKSVFNTRFEQFIFYKEEGGSQYVVSVGVIKNETENIYKAVLSITRNWGDSIKKY